LVNWDRMMKLKINVTFIEGARIKIRNQKNKDWSVNTNNKDGQAIIFWGGERKEGKKIHWRQTRPPSKICISPIERGHDDVSKDMTKRYFWTLGGVTRVTQSALPCTVHAHLISLFIQIWNHFWAEFIIKKNHYKKIKNPLDLKFNVFLF